MVERYGYDAYGKRATLDADGSAKSGDAVTVVGFTGRTLDAETGLWYFRARYYNEKMGIFICRNMLGYADGFSMYLALMGMKGYIDPTGLPGEEENGSWWNPLNWPGKVVKLAGTGLVATGIPVITHVGRTVESVGSLVESPGVIVEGAVTLNPSKMNAGAWQTVTGVVGTIGLGKMLVENEPWTTSFSRSPTDVTPSPGPYAKDMEDIWERIHKLPYEDKLLIARTGFHAWHVGSNINMSNHAGITEIPWILLGGVLHEVNPITVYDEWTTQGPVKAVEIKNLYKCYCFATL